MWKVTVENQQTGESIKIESDDLDAAIKLLKHAKNIIKKRKQNGEYIYF